jgi:GNAT superfamily N-acetyltransferase
MNEHIPTLRDTTEADSELCFQIKKKSFGDYIEEIWGLDEGVQRRFHEKDFEPSKFRIVQLGDLDIGLLGVRAGGNSMWVGQTYILPLHQNQGYGTHLIRDVISEAELQGKTVKLQVLKTNPARRLYDRLGFLVTGTNGPHHVMERPLSESVRPHNE